MSATRPYLILDEDEEKPSADQDSDFDLLNYDSEDSDSEDSEPEVIGVQSHVPPTRKPTDDASIKPPDVILKSYKLGKGVVIKPGITVELEDQSIQEVEAMHSGDFLRVKFIVMNLQTDEVRIRGYRMRRTKYLGQMFHWKTNELAMVLRVDEHDQRPPLVAGIEDVSIDEVIRIRECTLTNKPYPFLSFRAEGRSAYPISMTNEEIKRQMFEGGQLTCRVMNIQYIRKNAKPYSGVVRHLYAREADTAASPPVSHDGLSRETSITLEVDRDEDYVVVNKRSDRKRRTRPASFELEMFDQEPPKQKAPHPTKKGRLIFADVFCGAGGASQGASQAGYFVAWGLDNDERAIQAYGRNHPSAHTFKMNAHDFPPRNVSKYDLRVDVVHLSPPCCYWSPAHTCDGQNDQANYEAIYTVGPILKKVKPRVATIEQTFGLVTYEVHKRNFFMLLYDIGRAGYDVRYKIQDLSEFGLVQRRKRLLIIAARRGTPLPPFPKATHGPFGSGLKPPVYISHALIPVSRLGSRATADPYHEPRLFPVSKPPYNPDTYLRGCITTGGTTTYHPSGTRNFTARELCLLQSFPYTYKFVGPQGEAKKQIGNAFPPIMAEALYRNIAKTLKAFDDGIIGAEDDLSNLDEVLEQRGKSNREQREPGFSFSKSQPTNLPHRIARSDN
ncbi:S-adenosyl-L-methionine-dependent methyltransferase [Stemphylium lycopersici]|nr:S-adenosyl-L-methionine-dependent methyltransferase [Stemphylium lycopersici]